jgi:hypothetical protein
MHFADQRELQVDSPSIPDDDASCRTAWMVPASQVQGSRGKGYLVETLAASSSSTSRLASLLPEILVDGAWRSVHPRGSGL